MSFSPICERLKLLKFKLIAQPAKADSIDHSLFHTRIKIKLQMENDLVIVAGTGLFGFIAVHLFPNKGVLRLD